MNFSVVPIKSQIKLLMIISIVALMIFIIATGGGLITGIHYDGMPVTVVSSTKPSDLKIYCLYFSEIDKSQTIYVPFIYYKAVYVPHGIKLLFQMGPDGEYQTMKLLRVSEVSDSGKRDLTLQNQSLGFTFFNDGSIGDGTSYMSTMPFIIESVNHLEPFSTKVYEIVGMAYTKDGEQIEFQHTVKISLGKPSSYTIVGWRCLGD